MKRSSPYRRLVFQAGLDGGEGSKREESPRASPFLSLERGADYGETSPEKTQRPGTISEVV